MPPAIFVLALSLLQVAVYAQAAVIFVLLLTVGYLLLVVMAWAKECEQAEAERNEAHRTLDTLHRMSEIRVETVTRLREFGR